VNAVVIRAIAVFHGVEIFGHCASPVWFMKFIFEFDCKFDFKSGTLECRLLQLIYWGTLRGITHYNK
jgi:hypothetical protein